MGVLLVVIIAIIVSVVWLRLWTATYSSNKIRGFVMHTIVFILLSLLISVAVAFLIFSPVDDTYSASNKGALGLLYLLLISIFGVACLIAFVITLSRLLEKRKENKQDMLENIE